MRQHALILLLVSCPWLCGCLGLDKDYPEKKFFILETERFTESDPGEEQPILRVRSFRISPSYSGSEFLYRTGVSAVEADFYNEFLTPPSRLTTENVEGWMRASGLFKAVVDSSSPIEAKYVLEGNVRSIYGDYRQPESAAAVLEIQIFMTNEAAAEENLLFQKNYSKRIPIPDNSSEALVAGWNQCLQEMLIELESDLARIVLKLTP